MTEEHLLRLVEDFSDELALSLKAFTGEEYSLTSSSSDNGKIVIRLAPLTDDTLGVVPLFCQGVQILGIQPEFRCRWDSTNSFLAVETSKFSVFPYGNVEKAPLFRVEYARGNTTKPSSHFHVHAHRDEFTHLLGFAKKLENGKPKKIRRYLTQVPLVSNFHFPTGGHRFRPCLEDILETLRVEFNLDVNNDIWSNRLKDARLKWRKIQTAAVVRDCPEVAFKVLTEELGMPVPENWTCPESDQQKILRG